MEGIGMEGIGMEKKSILANYEIYLLTFINC